MKVLIDSSVNTIINLPKALNSNSSLLTNLQVNLSQLALNSNSKLAMSCD